MYCTEERYVIDPKEAVDLVDENTIGICCILGTTYTGQYEDVKAVNDLLIERGLDTPIHVDAASGGFVAPFVNPGTWMPMPGLLPHIFHILLSRTNPPQILSGTSACPESSRSTSRDTSTGLYTQVRPPVSSVCPLNAPHILTT